MFDVTYYDGAMFGPGVSDAISDFFRPRITGAIRVVSELIGRSKREGQVVGEVKNENDRFIIGRTRSK